MITVDFENRGEQGLCEYLYSSIKSQILSGLLKADEKLPSKRSLAEHLGVSIITVQNAYGQLISEGYIYSQEKKGFFVADIALDIPLAKEMQRADSDAQDDVSSAHQECSFFTDFTSNSTGVEKFPFSLWSHIMRQVLNSGDEKLLRRINVCGVYELRVAISRYLSDFRNMTVHPRQIIIGAGTESLYTMVVQLLGREKLYAVEDPGYHKVASVISLNGAQCRPVKIDNQGINPDELEKVGADVVHVSPAHHFPTGIVMPVRRRHELLSWASSKSDRYIIEDDYDSEFRFNGKPLQTLYSTDKSNRVIYINTFSKTLAPSFRLSFMVLPPNLVESFMQKLGFYSCSVSAFEQFTLAEFINQGHYGKHIFRMKNYYRTLRNNLISALENSSLSKIAQIQEEEAGLHFLLKINSAKSPEELRLSLQKNGINLLLLKDFYYSEIPEQSKSTFLVNYSAVRPETIAETVRRLEKSVLCE